MSRFESTAVAGYYPTPPHLVDRIRGPLTCANDNFGPARVQVFDPCAGDAAAVIAFARGIRLSNNRTPELVVIEMEATRFNAIPSGAAHSKHHADAFCVESSGSASILYLNPPYDIDPEYKRLEERFLRRFADTLAAGGVLVFIVPFYALNASAETIGMHFADVRCFRFPDSDFAAYRQVVLYARKAPRLRVPDPRIVTKVIQWSKDSGSIPELPEKSEPLYSVVECDGLWPKVRAVDVQSLRSEYRPWSQTDRAGNVSPIPGVIPESLVGRRFPVAMPPRPAHIAAGIASGVFDGARLEPDQPGLPALIVKGVFNREFRKIDVRVNKDGEVVGNVEVQQPTLAVTVMDLSTHLFHTIRSSSEITDATTVDKFTTADLLDRYRRAFYAQLMAACPVLHDPARDAAVHAPVARTLYRAQSHAVAATVKLLGGPTAARASRRGKAAIILGEIGSGKSTVALTTAATIGARKTLILCPPHLLDSWRDQAAAVLPEEPVFILRDVNDVDAFAKATRGIAVLSRETAKLGHAWEGVATRCPRCGANVPEGDLVKKRVHCEAQSIVPANPAAQLLCELSVVLAPEFGNEEHVAQNIFSRTIRRVLEKWKASPRSVNQSDAMTNLVTRVAAMTLDTDSSAAHAARTVLPSLVAFVGTERLHAELAERLYKAACIGNDTDVASTARFLLMMLGTERRSRLAETLKEWPPPVRYDFEHDRQWKQFDSAALSFDVSGDPGVVSAYNRIKRQDGVIWLDRSPMGHGKHALNAVESLAKLAKHTLSSKCGEPLFQAVPTPRRVPLATYISRRYPKLFDLLVIDEAHEVSSDGAAQERAAHRLTALGIPTLLLTGSVMNGYAESLFTNLWAISPKFREEFDRGDRGLFVERYGYRKRLVETRHVETGKVVAYGSVTDRVERKERDMGNAPGVLPLLVLRHLLPLAVTLHKSDLALELPPCTEHVEFLECDAALKDKHTTLRTALAQAIKKDQFGPRSGQLWGALAELPSHLDRSTNDTGNTDTGAYEIKYPDTDEIVCRAEGFSASKITVKEQWMLDKIRDELAENRPVMVLAWNEKVLPRLVRLIEQHLGEPCPVLIADKVAAGKRQAWIDTHVLGRNRRVLVVNPVAVQTGLNNLVHFCTQIWMQSPACNPIVYRQVVGRSDRIGKTQPTRIWFPVYTNTMQQLLHRLLMHKVAVSMSTDGLDAESALAAAGATEDTTSAALSVGKQLYEMMQGMQ